MIYKEHGLTSTLAIENALNEAKIEATIYIVQTAITTDAICIIDTIRHDRDVRAEAIKEFAEWLEDNDYLWKIESSYEEQNIDFLTSKTVIDEYEKEQLKEQKND